MEGKASRFAAGFAAVALLAVGVPAFGQDGVPIKGVIIRHQDSTIVVRGGGRDTTIQITGATKIRGSSGALGARTTTYGPSELLRGLAVDVSAVTLDGRIEATAVNFKNSDLKTAR